MRRNINTDPVCGMDVKSTRFVFEFEGKQYLFCSKGCMDEFINSPHRFKDKNSYDLVIIGGGPAGLTAAVYASLSKIDTFLIADEIGGQAIDSAKIKNYMGYDFITGKELIKKFQDQFLNEHYLAHRMDRVLGLEKQNGAFLIRTGNREEIVSKAVIIATGMKKRKLGIPGEERLQRKGISYSSVHDIDLFNGLHISVIGGGNSGIQTAEELLNVGCRVTLVTQGQMLADPGDIEKLQSNPEINILEGYDVIRITGRNQVEGIVIQSEENRNKKKITCQGVFIQVGFMPNTEFCRDLLNLNTMGEIVIDQDCSAGHEGLFACGDVTNIAGKRIIIASGEGAKAALSAKNYLRSGAGR